MSERKFYILLKAVNVEYDLNKIIKRKKNKKKKREMLKGMYVCIHNPIL